MNAEDKSRLLGLAEHYVKINNLHLAESILKEVTAQDYENTKANELLACIYSMQDKSGLLQNHLKIACRDENASFISLYQLGSIQLSLNQYQEAKILLQRALDKGGDFFEGLHDLGTIYAIMGDYEQALALYNKASKLNNNSHEIFFNIARIYDELKYLDEALMHYETAIKINPTYAEAWLNKGVILNDLKQYDEALIHYETAISLNPDYAEAWSNKGNSLKDLKRFDEALVCYETAIKHDQNYAEAWLNKGVALNNLQRHDEAINSYNQAIQIDAKYSDAIFNRSLTELYQLQFKNGWEDYEARWQSKGFNSKPIITSKLRWQGHQIDGILFIWAEQGIGDQILFGSVLNELQNIAKKIIISVDKKLLSIFSRSFPSFIFVDKDLPLSEDLYSQQIPIASICQYFRGDVKSFNFATYPFLFDNPNKTKEIKSLKPFFDKKTCGISWKSSNHKIGADKSLPLNELLPILSLDEINFINLQYGDTYDEIETLNNSHNTSIFSLPGIDVFDDIDGLLSIISACDYIVTSSNSTAHLAGALGKKVFLLIPHGSGKLWYWKQVNGKSLWYPSIQIFQQGSPGDWSAPVNQIKSYLESEQ